MESKTRRNSKFRLVLWVMLLFATPTASAQQVKVTGTVTDPGGEPLVGVSVKAGATGAITDIDGKYSVEVASSGSISFSYVGFETIMEKVNGRKTINVTLKEKNDVLNEVVVIGYGTMDKKELTSAISHVGEKDFLTISSLDPSMMIQGKVAGVSITKPVLATPTTRQASRSVACHRARQVLARWLSLTVCLAATSPTSIPTTSLRSTSSRTVLPPPSTAHAAQTALSW